MPHPSDSHCSTVSDSSLLSLNGTNEEEFVGKATSGVLLESTVKEMESKVHFPYQSSFFPEGSA